MIESLFTWKSVRLRQLEAPLLWEREQYLRHIFDKGTSIRRVKTVAVLLLHVVRILELDCPRIVEMSEIERGGQVWSKDTEHHVTRKPGPGSAAAFQFIALKWLRFHALVVATTRAVTPIDTAVNDFVHFMRQTRGMSETTIRSFRSRTFHFLQWAFVKHQQLSTISLSHVDEFLEIKRQEGRMPRTLGSYCSALRLFFHYAEMRGWSNLRLAHSIRGPRVARYDPLPKGIPWRDVRRLLDGEISNDVADLRASVILFLCAVYGFRSSEVVNLVLADFDWINETLTVRRSKRGRVQQYPIQFEVGEVILNYLRLARPHTACRTLILSLRAPYHPIAASGVWTIIANRIRRLRIDVKAFGPHSLRHACATELLRKGSSLKEIADFLGHRDLQSVSIYAKHDVRNLKKVASFRLSGLK